MIHPGAWFAWAGAVLVALSLTRNPYYLGLILTWIGVVHRALRPIAVRSAPVPLSPVRFGLFVVTFSALFNALTVHFGSTVLFIVPKFIPLFGGPVTLEALVYGVLNGLVLSGMFAAFTVLNRALTLRQMIRLVPRAFFPVAVVTSIAITFVPLTLRHFQQIREAQTIRGHRVRGLRDWRPLLMPLLVGGLERALQLAEAMTARGFASSNASVHGVGSKLAVISGMVLILAGWLLQLVWRQVALGLGLLLVGIALIGGALWVVGRRVPRTTFRPQAWAWYDWTVLGGAAVTTLGFAIPWSGLDRSSLFYYPYPTLTQPTLNLFFAGATVGLLIPALVLSQPHSLAWQHIIRQTELKRANPLSDQENS